MNSRASAELEREEIQTAIQEFQERIVRGFFLCLQLAAENSPAALQVHIDHGYRAELDRMQTAIIEYEKRLDRLEARP